MRYAFYIVPERGRRARKLAQPETDDATEARRLRSKLNRMADFEVAVHADRERGHHPDPLPYGETLWRERRGRSTGVMRNEGY